MWICRIVVWRCAASCQISVSLKSALVKTRDPPYPSRSASSVNTTSTLGAGQNDGTRAHLGCILRLVVSVQELDVPRDNPLRVFVLAAYMRLEQYSARGSMHPTLVVVAVRRPRLAVQQYAPVVSVTRPISNQIHCAASTIHLRRCCDVHGDVAVSVCVEK